MMARDLSETAEILKEHGLNFVKLVQDTHAGTMLRLGTLLDECLEIVLKAYTLDSGKEVNEKNFLKNGKLYNLADKIEEAKKEGLLDEVTYKDVDVIRLIRNEFAHLKSKLHFDSARIVTHVRRLSTYEAANTNQAAILEAVGKVFDRLKTAVKVGKPKGIQQS